MAEDKLKEQALSQMGKKDLPQSASGRSQQRRSPGVNSQIPSSGVGEALQQQGSAHKAQMAALQGQIIRAQNDASKMTMMLSHQISQVKNDLSGLIGEYYGYSPDTWPENWASLRYVLPEVDQFLGDEYTQENKLLLQDGAFTILATQAHQQMLLGIQPITIYDVPALAGYQDIPALGPAQ